MKNVFLITLASLSLLSTTHLEAHCQIPCGIYNDDNVIESMQTDLLTIEKATKTILELQKDPSKNAHQLTRWVNNKESHAQALQDKVLNYFLAQRLKPTTIDAEAEVYFEKLQLCHRIIVTAMICKQSPDEEAVVQLSDYLNDFEEAFGSGKEKPHSHE